MIANITNGRDFGGLFRYLTGARDSNGLARDEVSDLGGTIPGSTPAEWSRAMEAISAAHPSVNVKVKHWSLRFAPEDMQSGKVNYGLMSEMASEFSERMGATAWRAFSHGDHFHIAANRVRHDGTIMDDSWDYRKAEEVCRDFEKRYGLRVVKSSTELEPTEHKKRPTQGELNAAVQSGTPSNRMVLQEIIDAALSEKISASDFIDVLKMNGVDTRFNTNKAGISGVTFSYDGMFFKGQSLGKAYTAGNLKKRGLDYVEARDRQRVEQTKSESDYIDAGGELTPDAGRLQSSEGRTSGFQTEVVSVGRGTGRGDQASSDRDGEFSRQDADGIRSMSEVRQDVNGVNSPDNDAGNQGNFEGEQGERGVVRRNVGEGAGDSRGSKEASERKPSEDYNNLSRFLIDRRGDYSDIVAMVLADEESGRADRLDSDEDVPRRGLSVLQGTQYRIPTNTMIAIDHHVKAIGVEDFEIAILPPTGVTSLNPLKREFWKVEDFKSERKINRLRAMNARGYEIYFAPGHAENQGLIFLDDVPKEALADMKAKGFSPVSFIESSPGNYQATIRVSETPLTNDEANQCGRILAEAFGGDRGSTDWRHMARLAGFTNRKPKHIEANGGRAPFVKLHYASPGLAERGPRLVELVRKRLVEYAAEAAKQRPSARVAAIRASGDLVPRDPRSFFLRHAAMLEGKHKKSDGSTDWSTVDYGAAAEMIKAGYSHSEVVSAILECSPELDIRKGKDQEKYAERTVSKAEADPRTDPRFRR